MNTFLHPLLQKKGLADLPEFLGTELPGSTLNSVLLSVFQQKAARLRPADVLRAYAENRFVKPSSAPFLDALRLKNEVLLRATEAGFQPLQLSPVCPLGTCSAVGLAHQDKVLTATRGSEVVADATNVLALESALRRKDGRSNFTLRLCATHRHIRTQVFDFEGFTPHFDVFCMTSAGRDQGHCAFEQEALAEHLGFYFDWSKTLPSAEGFRAVFTPFSPEGEAFCERELPALFAEKFSFELLPPDADGERYYRFLRAKFYLTIAGKEFEIGDCGFTNWTARLLNDRKERLFISGLGLELVVKSL